MIKISDKSRDIGHVVAALLWIILAVINGIAMISDPILTYIGLLVSTLLMVIYFVMGATVANKIGLVVPLIYPIVFQAILWIIAYSLVYFTKGEKMEFIMGMHPGFFGAVICYWIGTFLASTLGLGLFFDKYLCPEEQWNAFMKDVSQMQKLNRR